MSDDTTKPHAPPSPLRGVKVAPKYRDPVTGLTWAGRGKTPAWVLAYEVERGAGSREDLRISEARDGHD